MAISDHFRSMDGGSYVREKLNSSSVIFSTLASSGCSALRQCRAVDSLLVDEAGACTEWSTCIPFHLR